MKNNQSICKILIKASALLALALSGACRSPLKDLEPPAPLAMAVRVSVEDHSRSLKRIRPMAAGEANTKEARAAALDAQRAWMETEFRREAQERGLAVEDAAALRLELRITSLGEVRARYIVYGIAGGVAWGVGTGLVAHDPRLALGLGLYELIEESAFWIVGSSVFGAYSAPAVVEAALFDGSGAKAAWSETYYVINGRKHLKELPEAQRSPRDVQLHASLRSALDKVFKDLEALKGFPRRAAPPRAFSISALPMRETNRHSAGAIP